MAKLTKLSFGFTTEDMKLIKELRAHIRSVNGTDTNIAVIRDALRRMAREVLKKAA